MKEQRGGNRQGAGRKYKFNVPTKTVAFLVPLDRVDELKAIVKRYLDSLTSFYCQKPIDYKPSLKCDSQCGLCAKFEGKKR